MARNSKYRPKYGDRFSTAAKANELKLLAASANLRLGRLPGAFAEWSAIITNQLAA
jgi:hypothetical protein